MSDKRFIRGVEVQWDELMLAWVSVETGEPAPGRLGGGGAPEWPCGFCGLVATESHGVLPDPCLGYIEGLGPKGACCGHGGTVAGYIDTPVEGFEIEVRVHKLGLLSPQDVEWRMRHLPTGLGVDE